MYTPVRVVDAVLLAPLVQGQSIMHVDLGLYDYLANALPLGDWTYLKISQANRTEVVKVWGLIPTGYVVVSRKIDNTEEHSFQTGARIESVDTVAGILDSFAPPTLQLTPQGAIEYSGQRINYADLVITAAKGTEIVGEEPKLQIAKQAQAYGCCPVPLVSVPQPPILN